MDTLFDFRPTTKKTKKLQEGRPLADRLRPQEFSELIGQALLFEGIGSVEHLATQVPLPSLIFWGPPGCGKTSLAKILAGKSGAFFEEASAVFHGVAQFKEYFDLAERRLQMGVRTVLLVDEIHRLNRAQQDIFLPHLESGVVTLIGTTTENPSFELNAALLSRCKVVTFNRLDPEALEFLLRRAEALMQGTLPLTAEARTVLCHLADGDGRYLLNRAEDLFALHLKEQLTPEKLLKVVRKRAALYDKSRDEHYNLISVLHKSLRGSDVNAALYWMARMLEGGEDPLYILRRLVRFASEDVGLADPQALSQAISAVESYRFLGSPEGDLVIAQLVVYLATAPKSVSVYKAFKAARKWAQESPSLMPPKSALNAPTRLMKEHGYSAGYIYDPDTPEGIAGQNFLPEELEPRTLYHPIERGFEREIKKRLLYWERLVQEHRAKATNTKD
ncbi:MAG: replication-associated recombination protein A [Holosporales bacterium]|jgi:putative ATPase|nr:replication-associated recombination protein A [Holosporales bacterium]